MNKYVKKAVALSMAFSLTFTVCAFGGTDVYIEDNIINFQNQPVIKYDTLFVPFDTIFESFGTTVNWEINKAVVSDGIGNIIKTEVGSSSIVLNDKHTFYSDYPIQIIEGFVYIPIDVVAEIFNANIYWNTENNTAKISLENENYEVNDVKEQNDDIYNNYVESKETVYNNSDFKEPSAVQNKEIINTFKLQNNTGIEFKNVYASLYSDDEWYEIPLGGESFLNGDTFDITISDDTGIDKWDLKVEGKNGVIIIWNDIPLLSAKEIILSIENNMAIADIK